VKKSEQGFLPSGSTVGKCAKQLELHATSEYQFDIKQVDTIHGPVYSFDIHNLIRKVCQAFLLESYAVTGFFSAPVQLTYTMDGAQLTNDLGHVTGGVKVVDPRAIDPSTGVALAASGNFQSRDYSFVVQLAFVKDSKMAYKDCFAGFLSTFNNGRLVIPATDRDPELSNFDISSCQDLSLGKKTTFLGGGCHSTNYFCPQCMVSRDTMTAFKSGEDRCQLCIDCNVTRCYCLPVRDPAMLETTQNSFKEYIERTFDIDCKKLQSIMKRSTIIYDDGALNNVKMKNHIDYEPQS
jgi:hypothetical protein